MSKLYKCLITVSGFFMCVISHADANDDKTQIHIECPSSIKVQQSLIRDLPGWQAEDSSEDGIHILTRVSIFSGPPQLLRELKPSFVHGESRTVGQKLVFNFDGNFEQGIYVACRFDTTTVIVSRQIFPTPQTCSFEYRSQTEEVRPVEIICN